ncbi:MAG: hypothetical protein M3417_04270 [Actinomycetota bacterium]|nr:hypothetical protein [Actinomycetota bacterium]
MTAHPDQPPADDGQRPGPPATGERRGPGRPWADRPLPASAGEHRVVTGSASRASRGRKVAHGLAGGAAWVGFGWLWVLQITQHLPPEWEKELIGIAGTLAAFTVLTLGWVRWNRDIYRRRHRRTVALVQPVSFARDTLGRRITASADLRHRRGEIVISLTGSERDVKCYTAGRAVEGEPAQQIGCGAVA